MSRTFEFKTKTEAECDDWVRKIAKSIKHSKGNCDNLKIVGAKFWKGKNIREEDLLEHAQTGDILLFRSKSFNSKMQRSLTRSFYGEVVNNLRSCGNADAFQRFRTLFIRSHSNRRSRAYILEWPQTLCTLNLPQVCLGYKSRVAYRKLNMERTPIRMKKLEAFLHESYGKQYHISVRKLMQRKSVVVKEPSQSFSSDSSLSDDRTFFCS